MEPPGVRTSSRLLTVYAVLGFVVFAGVYFRIEGLEKPPFAVDEFYITTAVQNTLKYGLPRFPCGGYYERGILVQNMAAPFFAAGVSEEFSFRFITVLFSHE